MMDIAVIGISGRFPGAANIDEFYRILKNGLCSVRPVTHKRKVISTIPYNIAYRQFAQLDDIDCFDYRFFEMSLGEAQHMDPHQRILLEVVYETFEKAGYNSDVFSGTRTSLFIGNKQLSYYKHAAHITETLITGNINSLTAGRIARHFNLRGAAMMVDTACSSSLIALKLACQDIMAGDSDHALVCGIDLMLFPLETGYDGLGILAKDGKTKAFADGANGTGLGEFAACLLLKPLAKAIADHDQVHAVIKGIAVNQDGALSASLTAPDSYAQAELIQDAWIKAGINPLNVSYVEAHGTGTKLGDPIEVKGLNLAFEKYTQQLGFCAVSSVKSNIGHSDSAAGMAGIVKTILSLKHKQLFPSINVESGLNRFIDFKNSSVYVNATLKDWDSSLYPRTAGVSSFGLMGTNCHVVLQEAPPVLTDITNNEEPFLFPVSAVDDDDLLKNIAALKNYLQISKASVGAVSQTLIFGRKHFNIRAAWIAYSQEDLIRQLAAFQFNRKELAIAEPVFIYVLSDQFDADQNLILQLCDQDSSFKYYYEECISTLGTTEINGKVLGFIFQYSLYRTIEKRGLKCQHYLSEGMGRIMMSVIKKEVSLKEGLLKVCEYQAVETHDMRDKLLKFVLNQERNCVFIEIGKFGRLSKYLAEISHQTTKPVDIVSISKSLLHFFCDLYLLGYSFDWGLLFENKKYDKVELPSYQFKKSRCWLKEADPILQDSFYEYNWEEVPGVIAAPGMVKGSSYLIFMDELGLGKQICQLLESEGCNVISIYNSTEIKLSEKEIQSPWDDVGSASKMWKYLEHRNIAGIIHLGGVLTNGTNDIKNVLSKTIYSHVVNVKAFSDFFKSSLVYAAVTCRGRMVGLNDHINSPALAMSHGFIQCLREEFPLINSKCIDIDLNFNAGQLLNEILCVDKTIIGFRNGIRFIPAIRKAQYVNTNTYLDVIEENGTYLITGGASGIGLVMAKHFGFEKHVNLVILGRQELPFQNRWHDSDLNFHDDVVITFREIEKWGSKVTYYQCDISDLQQCQNVKNELIKAHPKINGILHCAGVPGTKLIKDHTFSSFDTALKPKVWGTLNLFECFKSMSPDFFVMFSSADALAGSLMDSNYCSANIFQDNFVYTLRAQGVKGITINWSAWKETGMWNRFHAKEIDRDETALTNVEGIYAFNSILRGERMQVVVSKFSAATWLNNPYFLISKEDTGPRLDLSLTIPMTDNSTGIIINNNQWNKTENDVANIWASVLKNIDIKLSDDFFDLGGHSLNSIQILNQVNKQFNVVIEFEDLLNFSTIQLLSKLIIERRQELLVIHRSLDLVEEQDHYGLSHGQRRMWILDSVIGSKGVYNMPAAFKIEGALSIDQLNACVRMLMVTHEILRTYFVFVDGEPRQVVMPESRIDFSFAYHDYRSLAGNEAIFKEQLESNCRIGFNLSEGPLLRGEIYHMSDECYIVSFTMHHIVSDGWSEKYLIIELMRLYKSLHLGMQASTSEIKIQYKDYVRWQQRRLDEDDLKLSAAYWHDQFKDGVPVLELPLDRARKSVHSYDGKTVRTVLQSEVVAGLDRLGKEEGCSLFMTLLASVNVLLYGYSGQQDMVLGVPIAGRNHSDLENQLGFYVNTLAFRVKFSKSEGFRSLLRKVKQVSTSAYAHQDYPFDKLVDELSVSRDMSRSPLFDVLVVYENLSEESQFNTLPGAKVSSYPLDLGISKFDISFQFRETLEGVEVKIEYNKEIFNEERMHRMLEHYQQLLHAVQHSSHQPIEELKYLTSQESYLLAQVNSTSHPLVGHTLVDLFEICSMKYADRIAVVYKDSSLSYGELDRRSFFLARFIREKMSGDKGLVGVIVERSLEHPIVLMGILRSGSGYVPIDPSYPLERRNQLIGDCGLSLVITDDLSGIINGVYYLNILEEDTWSKSGVFLEKVELNDIAYVIHTSGSTGSPKGVAIPHEGIVNRLSWMYWAYAFNGDEVIFQKTPNIFDVSVWELFLSMCYGLTQVQCSRDVIYDPEQLCDHISRYGVTTIHFVPGMYDSFLSMIDKDRQSQLVSLRHVMSSGEALSSSTVRSHYRIFSVPLHNLYGPTEASVDVSYYETHVGEERVPIGVPIWNTQLYVLNSGLLPQGIGQRGELYIGGVGVAFGYLNKPEQTFDRFIANPFGSGYLYKTGDICYWNESCQLCYVSRNDNQIKIRGYRIELGEIEHALQAHSSVKQAVVTVRDDGSGDKELIGYVSFHAGAEGEGIQDHLREKLPSYMQPADIQLLDDFPVTTSGKLDRQAISKLRGTSLIKIQGPHIAARNPIEETLIKIWSRILNTDNINIFDNFFEIGGNSIRAIRLHQQLTATYPGVFRISDLYQFTTIHDQAKQILPAELSVALHDLKIFEF